MRNRRAGPRSCRKPRCRPRTAPPGGSRSRKAQPSTSRSTGCNRWERGARRDPDLQAVKAAGALNADPESSEVGSGGGSGDGGTRDDGQRDGGKYAEPSLLDALREAGALASRLKSGKAEKAAREFESTLLASLFDSLQKSFSFDADDQTPGVADYRLMATRALAEAVSEGGGIGIARMVLSHLQAPSGQAAE